MKRIQVVDFLRGIAILFMMLFHGSYYWDTLPSKTQMNLALANPLSGLAIMLGKFAGLFALISGLSNAISMYGRLSSGKAKPMQVFYSGFITGFWVIFMGKIQSSLFNHTLIGDPVNPYPDGPFQYSLIIGSMKTGQLQLPSVFILLYKNTALFAIGLSIILTGFVLAVLSFKEGYKKVKRNLFILGSIATIIIFSTDAVKAFLRPNWVDAYVHKQHLKGLWLSILIGDSYPFFPFIGYTMYGAMFGIAFQQEIPRKKVMALSIPAGLIYSTTGFIILGLYGHPDITETFHNLHLQWNLIQIGMLILLISFCYWFHFSPRENIVTKTFESKFVRRFGLMTLTIFMFEPLVGTSIKLALDRIFPGWAIGPVLPFLYGFFLIFLWYGILLLLDKKANFVGTLEWVNGRITSSLARRDPTRMNIKENLYYVPERLEEEKN